jgi:hypothetical protein
MLTILKSLLKPFSKIALLPVLNYFRNKDSWMSGKDETGPGEIQLESREFSFHYNLNDHLN